MKNNYDEIAESFKLLGLDYFASKEVIEERAKYLIYVWRHESSSHNQEYADVWSQKVKEIGEAKENLLSLSGDKIKNVSIELLKREASISDAVEIFISYAREDEDAKFAERLYRDLSVEGLVPWIDTKNLVGGERWKPSISKAIRESDYFIALLSNKSLGKVGFVQKELRIAFERQEEHPEDKKFIIPVRIDDCKIEDTRLRKLQRVDLFPDYNIGLERILDAIR